LIINDNLEENMLTLVCNTYKLDMQPLKNELNIFNRMFASKYPNISGESNIFKKKSEYIANHDIRSGFPLTYTIFKTFLTIPTNTASCERSFSCLRRLKTYLRTTMGQERLSSLSLLQIEKNQQIDEEKVIDEFNSSVSVSGRRLALA